jgi:hypothetical protein
MEHCYSATTIYYENGQTTWCEAPDNHGELKSTLSLYCWRGLTATHALAFWKHVIGWVVQLKCEPCIKGIMGLYAMGKINSILEA